MKSQRPKNTVSPDKLEQSETIAYATNKWSRTVVQPFLIALVMTAFFTSLTVVITILTDEPVYINLWPMFFLTILEAIYTTIWLDHPERRQLNKAAYRAAEFTLILLILRVYTWALTADFPHLSQLADYLRYPYLLVSDGVFIVGAVLVFLAWARAIITSHTFNVLAIDRAEAYYYTLPPNERDIGAKPAFSNRAAVVDGLLQQWVAGGVVLMVVAAVVALAPFETDIQNRLFSFQRLNLPTPLILVLLIYFVGGLILLSQAHLGALNARWLHKGVIKQPEVERGWHRYTTWLLLTVAIVALFLPLGSTFIIGQILEKIFVAIATFVTILSYLFVFLLGLLLAPFNNNRVAESTPEAIPTSPPPTPQPTALPTSTAPADETAQLIFSSAFWTVAIVMAVIAISFFLRDRGVRLNVELFKQLGRGLLNWVGSLWQDTADYANDFSQVIRTRLQRKESKEEVNSSWRFFRLNALSPRDQIRYFYLSTVKRAKDKGVKRDQSETPLEYSTDLKESWPDAEVEIDDLTDAFLRARYSQDNIEESDVNPVKKDWKKVKSRIRNRIWE
ncbi:MAG: DUF4129 domain-containing protein [Chloroflexi bacterium]|nr:DUF4129 domain-containing protein [Chloroflexota bacterium]